MHVNFPKYTTQLWPLVIDKISFQLNILSKNWQELWPLIISRISFPLSILRINRWNLIRFYIFIDLNQVSIGFVTCQFSQIYNRVMVLGYCQRAHIHHYTHRKLLNFLEGGGGEGVLFSCRPSIRPSVTFWFLSGGYQISTAYRQVLFVHYFHPYSKTGKCSSRFSWNSASCNLDINRIQARPYTQLAFFINL